MKSEKNVRIEAESWELLKAQAKRLGRTLKGHIKMLAEAEEANHA